MSKIIKADDLIEIINKRLKTMYQHAHNKPFEERYDNPVYELSRLLKIINKMKGLSDEWQPLPKLPERE